MKRTGITAIYLENFKGISECVKIPLKPITLLFGANSAGKSTIIQAIHYIREIILRNNPNANFTEIGGESIDLGGFNNLINLHDNSKKITIGFEITPDDDGIPNYSDMFDINHQLELGSNYYTHIDINAKVETFRLDFVVSYDTENQMPWVSQVKYNINDDDLLDIVVDRYEAKPYISNINLEHELFNGKLLDEYELEIDSNFLEVIDYLFDSEKNIRLEYSNTCILSDKYPVIFNYIGTSSGMEIDFKSFNHFFQQILLGTLSLLKEHINQFRYLGPIRKIPNRHHIVPSFIDENRWADGMAAWDLLYNSDFNDDSKDSLITKVNKYLSEQYTDVGYELTVKEYRELPTDNIELLGLKKLLVNFEDEDESLLKKFLNSIEGIQVKKRIELRDINNNIFVRGKDIGVGISQVIPVIVGSISDSKKIFAIEQPELHLHPKVQCNLADVFVEEMNKDNERIFLIETHSEHLVLRLQKLIRNGKLKPEDISIIFVSRDTEGSKVTTLRLDEEGCFIDSWPGGFFPERRNELRG